MSRVHKTIKNNIINATTNGGAIIKILTIQTNLNNISDIHSDIDSNANGSQHIRAKVRAKIKVQIVGYKNRKVIQYKREKNLYNLTHKTLMM